MPAHLLELLGEHGLWVHYAPAMRLLLAQLDDNTADLLRTGIRRRTLRTWHQLADVVANAERAEALPKLINACMETDGADLRSAYRNLDHPERMWAKHVLTWGDHNRWAFELTSADKAAPAADQALLSKIIKATAEGTSSTHAAEEPTASDQEAAQ